MHRAFHTGRRRPDLNAAAQHGRQSDPAKRNTACIGPHERGVDSVRRTTEECARLKIEQLTLYCLSSENWKRPQLEINFLMHLLEQYMIEERSTIMDNNVRVRMLGRRDEIPEQVLGELDKTVAMSAANTGMWLNLAINLCRFLTNRGGNDTQDGAAKDRRPRQAAKPGGA